MIPEQETQPQTKDENHKCGLGIVNAIVFNFNSFSDEQKLLLKPLLQRPDMANSFVTPGGFFRVHYDPTGPNEPGYDLNLLAEALDSTYKFEIDFLGYDIPPGDSATNPSIPSEEYGGDNRYDVYIGNLGGGFYGYTQFEYEVVEGSSRFTSYIMIDNDFLNYFSPGINGARVTVAHEFHHSIQGGNYIFREEDTFFYEITSTAMEEFVFDDVNDYYAYIPSYFRSPETPLPLTLGYNTATWNIYLRDNFDYDIIKRQWELMTSVRAMIAINNSIFEYGSSFAREFNKYGIWMYFTNYRAVPGKYFEEAVNYPLVEPTSVVQFTPPSQTLNMSSKPAAHSFITFVIPGSSDSLVTIVSNGDVQSAVGTPNNSFNFKYTLFSDSSSGERFLTENYSSNFNADNPAFWSVSEILNNVVVREDDVFNYPTEINLDKNIEFNNVNDISNYMIIGLPGQVNSSVNEFLIGEHPYDWNVYWDNGAQNNYLIEFNGSNTFNFAPGKAFWMLSKNPFSVSTQVNTVPLSSEYMYSISLYNGWNLISNPFERSVNWEEVKSKNQLLQNQVLYAWNGSWSNSTTMTPYKGYYFNNSGNLSSLKIPYDPNGSLGKASSGNQLLVNTEEYLKLSLSYENNIKSEIFIGIDENSSNGFDEYDYLAAPEDFEEVKISLLNDNLTKRERHLFIEQRPEIGGGQIFDIEIKTLPKKNITLNTEGIENFDAYELYLLEERLSRLHNLKDEAEIILTALHQYNNYKLLIGSSELINEIKKGLIPTEYLLYQNYPNPFNSRTILRFSLPEKNKISLIVYSILGELVETLINSEDYDIGNYEVEFDAGNLSSGVYLFRMVTGDFIETKKMVLLK